MPKPQLPPLKTLPDHASLRPDLIARFLDISLSHVYALVSEGEIPSLKVGKAGKTVCIPRAEFIAWYTGKRRHKETKE